MPKTRESPHTGAKGHEFLPCQCRNAVANVNSREASVNLNSAPYVGFGSIVTVLPDPD